MILLPAEYEAASNAKVTVLAVTLVMTTGTTNVIGVDAPFETVMLAVPDLTPVTVTTFPETEVVAIVASDEVAVEIEGVAIALPFES